MIPRMPQAAGAAAGFPQRGTALIIIKREKDL